MKEKECHMFRIFEETRKGLDLLKKNIEEIFTKERDKKIYNTISLLLSAIVLILGILVYKSIVELNIIMESKNKGSLLKK